MKEHLKNIILTISFVLMLLSISCQSGGNEEQTVKQGNTYAVKQPTRTRTVGRQYSVSVNSEIDVRIVEIDGHDYIVAANHSDVRPGGVSIMHSESCKCHKNK